MSSVKVKICGITNEADAVAAVEAGADALGFIFYAKSPRCVEAPLVKRILASLPPFVLTVGVFVNEDIKNIRDIIDNCGLSLAQLHGEESAEFCESLGRPVLKAIRKPSQAALLALAEYRGRACVRGFLVDAFSDKAYGGTGERADWELASQVAQAGPVVLAGGLTQDNVAEAVRTVKPYGVDVSSGVEASPGKKDRAKVRAFIHAAKLVS